MTATTTEKPAPAEPKAKAIPKSTADPKPAPEAKVEPVKIDRTEAVNAALAAGWSRASLTRTEPLQNTTIMWRTDRLSEADAARLDQVLDAIKSGKLQPPTRKTGGGKRVAGPSSYRLRDQCPLGCLEERLRPPSVVAEAESRRPL